MAIVKTPPEQDSVPPARTSLESGSCPLMLSWHLTGGGGAVAAAAPGQPVLADRTQKKAARISGHLLRAAGALRP